MRGERLLRRPAGEGPAGAGRRGRRAPVAPAVLGGGWEGLRHRRRPQGRPRALLRPRPHPQPPLPQIEEGGSDDERGGGGAGGEGDCEVRLVPGYLRRQLRLRR